MIPREGRRNEVVIGGYKHMVLCVASVHIFVDLMEGMYEYGSLLFFFAIAMRVSTTCIKTARSTLTVLFHSRGVV